MGFKPITGGTSWSKKDTGGISQTVADYRKKHRGARPTPEFEKVGNDFRILTGAQVTRKRAWTRKGIAHGLWGGFKTFVQTVSTARYWIEGAGNARRRKNAALNAGQKFDGGINKLVEDLAKGKNLLKTKTKWSDTEFEQRVAELHDYAETLKEKGGFSDAQIAERLTANLMESLEVLRQKGGDRTVYDRVIRDLTQHILPSFEQFALSPVPDQLDKIFDNMYRLEGGRAQDEAKYAFNGAVVATLRNVATFGSDTKKFKAFGGSRLKHDAFGGDPNALKTFNDDPATYQRFDGNYKEWDQCYKQWGKCRLLYERFGGNPAELEGEQGAAALRGWLNETFGRGSGDAFLQQYSYSRYRNGVPEHLLKDLGRDLQIELVPYRSLPYSRLDIKKIENLMGRRNERLRKDFEASLDRGVYDDTARDSLRWLRDLEDLRGRAKSLNDKQLLKEIRVLAKPMKSIGKADFSKPTGKAGKADLPKKVGKYDDLNIRGPNVTKFQKLIAEEAGYDFKKKKPTFPQSLDHLERLDRKGLERVLDEGFGDMGMSPSPAYDSATIIDGRFKAFEDRCEAAAQERDPNEANDATIAYYKYAINQRYQKPNGPPIGDALVEERLRSKRGNNRVLTNRDLRIIETKLPLEIVQDNRNAGGSELDFLLEKSNPQRKKNQEFKSDIGDEELSADVNLISDDDIKTNPDMAERERTIRLGKDEMKWDWRFHVTQLNDAEKNDLSLGLAKAGNKNVEVSKHQKDDVSCSEDFAKDIKNGIVWMGTAGAVRSDIRRQVQSSADLTQGKSGIRPQDVAFVTGVLSSASIASQFFSDDVTFLKDQKNAFNHPESAKLARYDTDQLYNDVFIAVRVPPYLGKPDGHYMVSLTLRAGFDQVRLKDGGTVAADPDSTISASLVCNIDCNNGGTVSVVGASFNYQAKAAPSANKISAPAEPIDEPNASLEPHEADPNLKVDINDEIPASPNKASNNRIVSGLTGGQTFEDVGAKLSRLLDEDDQSLSELTNNLFDVLNYANQLTGVLLPGSATSIARYASNILESDLVQNGDDDDLKAMLETLISNAEKYAQDGVLPE